MMKKRTALFAGTALLSLAAATALYAVNGDNCITREGYFNVNAASCTKKKDAYAGNDVFGDGAVPANEVDRIDPDADPKTATQAINNVGIVIDGAAPNGVGTDLDAKARAVGALIDSTAADSIATKLSSASELIDGSRALSDQDGSRLAGKLTSANDRIGTRGGNIISRINSAVGLIDAGLDAQTATLNKAIANIIGGAAADSTNGVIGTDAAPNGSGEIDAATDVAAKLRAVQSLISRNANPRATSVAEALIDVRGDGDTGGIIGNPAGDNTASILEQLTAARNLIDGRANNGVPVSADIDAAIQAVQGTEAIPDGAIGAGSFTPAAGEGAGVADTTIADAGSTREKLDALVTALNVHLDARLAGYAPAGITTLTAIMTQITAQANHV